MKTQQSAILKKALLVTGLMVCSQPLFAFEYNGYFRGLTGTNSSKGGPTCFQLAGAMSKYRLGNECQVYGEFGLGQEVAKTDEGAVFSANIMFSFKQ